MAPGTNRDARLLQGCGLLTGGMAWHGMAWPAGAMQDRVQTVLQKVKAAETVPGVDEVSLPGERGDKVGGATPWGALTLPPPPLASKCKHFVVIVKQGPYQQPAICSL